MSLGSHQQTIGKSQVHITPKWIIDALGPFDLDPCAAWPRPWPCAERNIPAEQDGLSVSWSGLVWLNPPFHRYEVEKWLTRMAQHRRGIALLHARTETAWFKQCWLHADSMLFMAQRLIFHKPDGSLQTTSKGEVANSGAPPLLVAFGVEAHNRLSKSGIPGAFVDRWNYRS